MDFEPKAFLNDTVFLYHGDNREVLKTFDDNSIHSIVCDPPYALVSIVKRFGGPNAAPAKGNDAYMRASAGFMGCNWDVGETVFATEFWAECYRVLKPGGHVLAFNGTRTQHRMVCAIEDAGFEIRDMIAWLYGVGFPKSHDVSKGIDKAAGAEREKVKPTSVIAHQRNIGNTRPYMDDPNHVTDSNVPVTPTAIQWQGWGTALKPALEPITLARKPLSEKTVAANVLKWGVGAINVDGCRVEYSGDADKASATPQGKCTARPGTLAGKAQQDYEKMARAAGWISEMEALGEDDGVRSADHKNWAEDWEGACKQAGLLEARGEFARPELKGRFPANVITDGSEEVTAAFPVTSSGGAPTAGSRNGEVYGDFAKRSLTNHGANSGSAARFFYSAKANKRDRAGSKHPTVKPISLIRYLQRLITPPGGITLDPFAGSGTSGEAAHLEGFTSILIEREDEYVADIEARLSSLANESANDNAPLFASAPALANAA